MNLVGWINTTTILSLCNIELGFKRLIASASTVVLYVDSAFLSRPLVSETSVSHAIRERSTNLITHLSLVSSTSG